MQTNQCASRSFRWIGYLYYIIIRLSNSFILFGPLYNRRSTACSFLLLSNWWIFHSIFLLVELCSYVLRSVDDDDDNVRVCSAPCSQDFTIFIILLPTFLPWASLLLDYVLLCYSAFTQHHDIHVMLYHGFLVNCQHVCLMNLWITVVCRVMFINTSNFRPRYEVCFLWIWDLLCCISS